MKKRWIYIALVLSMAMNAGIIGVLLVQWLSPDKPAEVDAQEHPFRDGGFLAANNPILRRQFMEARAENKPKIQRSLETRRAFVSSLQEQEFDQQKSRKLLKEYLTAISDMENTLGERLISFRTIIKDPKDVQDFNARIEQRRAQLDELAKRDTTTADSSFRGDGRLRERIADRIKQRRARWFNRQRQ